MSTIAQGGPQVDERHRPGQGRRVLPPLLAALLVLAWAAQAVASWMGGYQTVPLSTLQAELDRGQVSRYEVIDHQSELMGGEPWWEVAPPPASYNPEDRGQEFESPAGFAVVYTADHGRPRVAVPSLGRYGPPLNTSSSPSDDESRWLHDELLTSTVQRGNLDLGPAYVVAAWAGGLLALTTLLHIVLGPRPRRGTRWFWFWMLGITGGLGAVAYAVLEVAGWRAHLAPAPDRRSTGPVGFVVMITWSILIGFALHLLLTLVGATVTPL